MWPVTCSLIIILPISKPHINFTELILEGKQKFCSEMTKRHELGRIKPNAVNKL